MKSIQVDVLLEAINCPVVQMPGRNYPGIVIQGDTLRSLLAEVEDVAVLCGDVGKPGLSDAVTGIKEMLIGYVRVYEHAMKEAGRSLPYPNPEV